MLKAILFDCDGVLIDSEPGHLKAFQIVLDSIGISLTQEEYNKTYLAMDDKGCFETILTHYHRPADKATLKKLIHQKMAIYKTFSATQVCFYPGVIDFVRKVVGKYKLAIASGAFRSEIIFALNQGGIRHAFPVIVSAQDVKRGKPHPEPFLTALNRINAMPPHAPHPSSFRIHHSSLGSPPSPLIKPDECVVIEDSIHGVMAARAAGMKSVAVTNSYPREALSEIADSVINSMEALSPEMVENLCATG